MPTVIEMAGNTVKIPTLVKSCRAAHCLEAISCMANTGLAIEDNCFFSKFAFFYVKKNQNLNSYRDLVEDHELTTLVSFQSEIIHPLSEKERVTDLETFKRLLLPKGLPH